jgi:hypothetical protein
VKFREGLVVGTRLVGHGPLVARSPEGECALSAWRASRVWPGSRLHFAVKTTVQTDISGRSVGRDSVDQAPPRHGGSREVGASIDTSSH